MRVPRRLIRSLGRWSVFSLLMGCATTHGHFNAAARSGLEVGKTTVAEAIDLLGEPTRVVTDEVTGRQTALDYSEVESTLYVVYIKTRTRRLRLEFGEDGLLNGYEFSSGFDEDTRVFSKDAVDAIRPGSTPGARVLASLGQPDGRARCPTRFDRKCRSGDYWSYSYPSGRVRMTLGEDNAVADLTVEADSQESLPFPPGPWLEVGESSPDDVVAALGPPFSDRRAVDGRFLTYVRGAISPGDLARAFFHAVVPVGSAGRDVGVDVRGLYVFADFQTVHGYLYVSAVAGSLPPVPDRSGVAVGQSKARVLAELGEPHGRLRCPIDWMAHCERGTAWLWSPALPRLGIGEEKGEGEEAKQEPEALILYFDDEDTVTRIGPRPPLPEPT